jgi:hypothetical protein
MRMSYRGALCDREEWTVHGEKRSFVEYLLFESVVLSSKS